MKETCIFDNFLPLRKL